MFWQTALVVLAVAGLICLQIWLLRKLLPWYSASSQRLVETLTDPKVPPTFIVTAAQTLICLAAACGYVYVAFWLPGMAEHLGEVAAYGGTMMAGVLALKYSLLAILVIVSAYRRKHHQSRPQRN